MRTLLKVLSIDFLGKIIAAISSILLIRYMDISSYASYSFVIAAVSLGGGIVSNIFNKIYIVEYNKIQNHISALLTVQLLCSLVIALIAIPFFKNNAVGIIYTIVLTVTTCLFQFIRTVYQQKCKFSAYTMIDFFRIFFFIVAIYLIIMLNQHNITLSHVVCLQAFSMLFPFTILSIKNMRDGNEKKDYNLIPILKILVQKEQWMMYLYNISNNILSQLPVFFLQLNKNDLEMASYSSANKYYALIMLTVNSVNSVFLPLVNTAKDNKDIRNIYIKHNKITVIFVIGVLFAIVTSPFFVPLLDNGKYPGSVSIFQILCISAFISFLGSPYINYFFKLKKYKLLLYLSGVCLAISFIFNILFVPVLGGIGAAWSMLLSFGINNLAIRFIACRMLKTS